MHILVTGGAGFIGSHLSERLLKDGNMVTVIDNLDPFYPAETKRKNIASALKDPSYNFIEADIRDTAAIQDRIGKVFPDIIIHLAAKAGVRPSLEQPALYHDVNVNGTKNLLELSEKWNIKKFIFASSSSVYGKNPDVPWKEDGTELMPISPYAETKISGEELCKAAVENERFPVIVLRFFTVFGPRQRPDLAIHKFIRATIAGKAIPFYGDGSTMRDYTYIDDIIEGIMGAVGLDLPRNELRVYNLGNSKAVSLSELVEHIASVLKKQPSLDQQPEQEGDVKLTNASILKSQRDLGYSPRTGIQEGIQKFYEWYKTNSIN